MISVGELRVLSSEVPRSKILKERICTCGTIPLKNCSFWKSIDEQLRLHSDLNLESLNLNIEEDHLFQAHNKAFFKAIQAVSGKSFIVDSSKNIGRLIRLKNAGFNVVPIRLKRNILGVVNSGIKYHQKKQKIAYNYWYYYQKLYKITGYQVIKVNYESMTREPRRELSKLMERLGLSFENEQLNWTDIQSHYIGGNPMRYQKENLIQIDEKWKFELNWQTKLRTAGWLFLSKLPAGWQFLIFKALRKARKKLK